MGPIAAAIAPPSSESAALQRVVQGEAQLKTARLATRSARIELLIRSLRYWTTIFNLPPWAAALSIGSVAAILGAAVVMAGFPGNPLPLLLCVVFGYAAGGGVTYGFLRDEPGENDDQRRHLRLRRLQLAKEAAAVTATRLLAVEAGLATANAALAEIRAQNTSAMNVLLAVDVGRLYPAELEQFAADVFKSLGYVVRRTGQTGDQGVDVLAEKPGRRIAIQVKCYSSSVGNSAVQEVFAGMMHYRCDACVVFTNNYFTASARALAASTGCGLIDRDSIQLLIRGQLPF
jgi:hypothetical protein